MGIKITGELIILGFIFLGLTLWASMYLKKYKKYKIIPGSKKSKSIFFTPNEHVFESIPSLFPTVGILLTATGIIIGLWDFNADQVKSSVKDLLSGIKFSFLATACGLVLLLIFQKWVERIKREIEEFEIKNNIQSEIKNNIQSEIKTESEHISGTLKNLVEITNKLNVRVDNVQKETVKFIQTGFEMLQNSQNETNKIFSNQTNALIESMNTGFINLQNSQKNTNDFFLKNTNELSELVKNGMSKIQGTQSEISSSLTEGLNIIKSEINHSEKEVISKIDTIKKEFSNFNNELILLNQAILAENQKTNTTFETKFEDFIKYLQENNTKSLLEIMQKATEEFNKQMKDLVNKLVQENFAELNQSVLNLNTWQKENKLGIELLTQQFINTTESFRISSDVLKEVAVNTGKLVEDNSKLDRLTKTLDEVMVNDTKFIEITSQLTKSTESLLKTTQSFENLSDKLNKWVVNEHNFKESVDVLIKKLEEFRDLNGNVWDSYRKEMESAVSIIKDASTSLNKDIDSINSEFYERLQNTLENLDRCILTFLKNEKND
jgi:hypothetical protein